MGMGAGTKGGGGGQMDPQTTKALTEMFNQRNSGMVGKGGVPYRPMGGKGGVPPVQQPMAGKGGVPNRPMGGKGGPRPNNPAIPAAVPATTPVGKGGGVPLSQQPTLTTGRPFDFSAVTSPSSNVGTSVLNRSAPPAPNVSSTLQSPLQPYSGPQAGTNPATPMPTGLASLPGVQR